MTGKEELHPIGSFCSTAVTEGKKLQRTYYLSASMTIEWPPGLLRYKQDFMESDFWRGFPRGILENLWVAISKLGAVCGEASIISHTSFWKVCLHVPSCQACLCSQAAWMSYQDRSLSTRGSSEHLPCLNTNPWLLASILFVGSLYHLCLENQYYVPQKTWWVGTWFTRGQKLNSVT